MEQKKLSFQLIHQIRGNKIMKNILILLVFFLTIAILMYSWIITKNISCSDQIPVKNEVVNKWINFDISGRKSLDPLLLEYLKDEVIIKPNSLPYNLSDPFMLDPTSIELADLSKKIFKGKRFGIFFEAGAFHPEFHSMTVYLERYFGWTGLLVEPNPIQFPTLLYSNRKSYFVQACLSPQEQSQTLKMTFEGMQSKLTKTNSNSFIVKCFPIYSILLASNFTSIDYFVLDVEGFEMDVLKTIPFQYVNIHVFAIEHYNNKKPEELQSYMEGKGYVTVEKTTYDFIFIRKGSVYL